MFVKEHIVKKIIAFFIIFVLLLFSGCQKSYEQKVNEAFDNLLTDRYNYEQQDITKEGVQIAELIFEKTTYTIEDVSENQCIVNIVAPNVSEIFWDCFNAENYTDLKKEDYQTAEDELMSMIKDVLKKNEYSFKETRLEVPLVNGEPQVTYELADALYGGLYSLVDELAEYYSQGEIN